MSHLPNWRDYIVANNWPYNSYVHHHGFRTLYIRRGHPCYIDGRFLDNVVQIANIEAWQPGKGWFRTLVFELLAMGKAIYVENACPEFAEKLKHMGFKAVNTNSGGEHYFLEDSLFPVAESGAEQHPFLKSVILTRKHDANNPIQVSEEGCQEGVEVRRPSPLR